MHSYEETVREMIHHENEMMNHRITWLLTIQGFLFAALGFAWDKTDATLLVYLFSGLGSIVALISWMALYCSHKAVDYLREWWKTHNPNDQGPGVVGYWFKFPKFPLIEYAMPWWMLPVLFIGAWGVVAIINGSR